MQKRKVTQWRVAGRPDDGNEKNWTEVQTGVDEITGMLGLAAGSRLISMLIDRDHTTITWTFHEPLEAACPDVPSSSDSSGGPATA